MNKKFLGDGIIILSSIFCIILLTFSVYKNRSGEPVLHISVEEKEWIYDISIDREIQIPGPIGVTHIEVENGKVHVHDSPCTSKICVAAGWIDSPGEWIVCLPNRVFITIEGVTGKTQEVDDFVY